MSNYCSRCEGTGLIENGCWTCPDCKGTGFSDYEEDEGDNDDEGNPRRCDQCKKELGELK